MFNNSEESQLLDSIISLERGNDETAEITPEKEEIPQKLNKAPNDFSVFHLQENNQVSFLFPVLSSNNEDESSDNLNMNFIKRNYESNDNNSNTNSKQLESNNIEKSTQNECHTQLQPSNDNINSKQSEPQKLCLSLIKKLQKTIIVHYVNFIFLFVNGVLKGNMFTPPINNLKFRKIKYPSKNKHILSNKIKDILQIEESPKCRRNGDTNKNKNIFKQLLKRKAFNYKYLKFFDFSAEEFFFNFYLSENYNNIITEYKINKNKTKIIFFEEFLQKLKSKGKDSSYIDNLIEVAKTLFD